MSSNESEDKHGAKKMRRSIGSCDLCRKRKIKCDISSTPGDQCSNCVTHNSSCTHDVPFQKRGVKNYSRQVNALQVQLAKQQQQIHQLELALAESQKSQVHSSVLQVTPSQQALTCSPEPDNGDTEYLEMLEDLDNISLKSRGDRYFGPSSNLFFMHKMMSGQPVPQSWPEKKWTMHPWEVDVIRKPKLIFPEDDLIQDLVDLHFRFAGLHILHEPSFRRDVASGLHLVDTSFGLLLLTVCAVAARSSNDPRVMIDGAEQSAGWEYYTQTHAIRMSLFYSCPTLYDVQSCCLAAEYMLGTSAPQSGWSLVGLGVRWVVELGYHRRRPGPPTVNSELKKRVFWSIIFLDRHVSLYYGRPTGLRDEDFDAELPIDCDDVYWETGDPLKDFKQPVGIPSLTSAFIHQLRLIMIISFALRTIFGIRQSKQANGNVGTCMDNSISLLDSMLNSWFNNIPPHLRWDSQLGSHSLNPFCEASAGLYMSYYNAQLLFHRPFAHKSSSQSLPSLAICTHAARSQARLLEIWNQRFVYGSFILNQAAFTSGIVLSMNMRKRRAANMSYGQDLEDFFRCLRVLKSSLSRYNVCGRLIQTLLVLADIDSLDPKEWEKWPYFRELLSHPSSSNAHDNLDVLSGYMTSSPSSSNEQGLDFAELDPTLFGLEPAENTMNWGPAVSVNRTLFDDDAVNIDMWAGSVERADQAPFFEQQGISDWSAYMNIDFPNNAVFL